MTDKFLKVNKDLFNLGLNPTEILILAQIIEFNVNTGDCFISDEQLAKMFGISESTVKREIKKLDEEFGFITRDTRNVKGGKERHIKVNFDKIEKKLASVKMTLDEDNNQSYKGQNDTCTRVNLTLDKGQNDTIKDNYEIDNPLKDNLGQNFGVKTFQEMNDKERKEAFKGLY